MPSGSHPWPGCKGTALACQAHAGRRCLELAPQRRRPVQVPADDVCARNARQGHSCRREPRASPQEGGIQARVCLGHRRGSQGAAGCHVCWQLRQGSNTSSKFRSMNATIGAAPRRHCPMLRWTAAWALGGGSRLHLPLKPGGLKLGRRSQVPPWLTRRVGFWRRPGAAARRPGRCWPMSGPCTHDCTRGRPTCCSLAMLHPCPADREGVPAAAERAARVSRSGGRLAAQGRPGAPAGHAGAPTASQPG